VYPYTNKKGNKQIRMRFFIDVAVKIIVVLVVMRCSLVVLVVMHCSLAVC